MPGTSTRPLRRPSRPTPLPLPHARTSGPLAAVPERLTIGLESNSGAAGNVRAHGVRALGRIVALIALDTTTFLLGRDLLRALREAPVLGEAVTFYVASRLPAGYLGGLRFGVALMLGLIVSGSYGPGDRRRSPHRIIAACALATLLPLWLHLWSAPVLVAEQFVLTVAIFGAALTSGRLALDAVLYRYAPTPLPRTILVGPRADCEQVSRRYGLGQVTGFNVVGSVATDIAADRRLARLQRHFAEAGADTVMLCGSLDDATWSDVVRAAMTTECRIVANMQRLAIAGLRPSVLWRRGQPLVEMRAVTLRWPQLLLKRVLDLVGASLLLLCFAPVMAAVAVAVRLSSSGPILYGQRRLGRYGRSFRCFKFRSMYIDAEQRLRSDPALHAEYLRNDYKLPDGEDPRITRVGRFLRRTSLDELPQLLNVLRGNMSLVGPRPIVPDEIRHYHDDRHMLLLLKPGITGLWQVSGRSNLAYPARTNVELEYVEKWSLRHDIAILLRTVPAVLLQRGAH